MTWRRAEEVADVGGDVASAAVTSDGSPFEVAVHGATEQLAVARVENVARLFARSGCRRFGFTQVQIRATETKSLYVRQVISAVLVCKL